MSLNEKDVIISFGFDKNGEADFGVRCDIGDLTYKQMNELRAMVMVGIGTAEEMFRDAMQRRSSLAAEERLK